MAIKIQCVPTTYLHYKLPPWCLFPFLLDFLLPKSEIGHSYAKNKKVLSSIMDSQKNTKLDRKIICVIHKYFINTIRYYFYKLCTLCCKKLVLTYTSNIAFCRLLPDNEKNIIRNHYPSSRRDLTASYWCGSLSRQHSPGCLYHQPTHYSDQD